MSSPKVSRPTSKVMGSPMRTRCFTSSAGKPKSMKSFSSLVTFLRSSSSMRWMGLRPMMPRSSPLEVCSRTRMPGRIAASTPPMAAKAMKPSGVMYLTIRPISSMWPANITETPAFFFPFSTACTEPMTLVSTESATSLARSRNTLAAGCSKPEGEGASTRLIRNFKSFLCMKVLWSMVDAPWISLI